MQYTVDTKVYKLEQKEIQPQAFYLIQDQVDPQKITVKDYFKNELTVTIPNDSIFFTDANAKTIDPVKVLVWIIKKVHDAIPRYIGE